MCLIKITSVNYHVFLYISLHKKRLFFADIFFSKNNFGFQNPWNIIRLFQECFFTVITNLTVPPPVLNGVRVGFLENWWGFRWRSPPPPRNNIGTNLIILMVFCNVFSTCFVLLKTYFSIFLKRKDLLLKNKVAHCSYLNKKTFWKYKISQTFKL